ncbi:MAG TPA: hypothetical protein VGR82_05590 [Methylomirabilota bacterium]|nr:hypothetical protein [Methylomirabilota bacterium]
MTTRLLVLLLLCATLAACATPAPSASSRTSTSSTPRARCLANPNDPMRPLIFLLCVESP